MISFAVSNFTFGLSRLAQHQEEVSQSLERLSSGKRINRAKDDPSGLQAVTGLKAQEYGIRESLESFDRERAYLGTQEGALSVISGLLIELNGYTVTAGNDDALTDAERQGLTEQVESIVQGIDQIVTTAEIKRENVLSGFNARDLASGSIAAIDPETGEEIQKAVTLTDLSRLLFEDPELAQSLAKEALDTVSSRRGAIGNRLNAIDHESNALLEELENTTEARSLIEDADVAEETAKLVRAQILESATIKTIQLQRESLENMLELLGPAKTPPAAAA